MMYSMKEACVQTGMSYETLKFYCKEGLVPNVKRDSHNYRVFDDRDIKWIQCVCPQIIIPSGKSILLLGIFMPFWGCKRRTIT